MKPINPPELESGRYVSSKSGLIVPRNYASSDLTSSIIAGDREGIITRQGFNQGHNLVRDEKTLIVRWFQKGSGLDDWFMSKIVDGTVGNIGISPVIAPLISKVIQRQVMEASTASIELTGRKSTVRRAREAISRFDDSPLGGNRCHHADCQEFENLQPGRSNRDRSDYL